MTKPTIAITMGDPSGVGPEISVLGASHEAIRNLVNVVIVGDSNRLGQAAQILYEAGRLHKLPIFRSVTEIRNAGFHPDSIHIVDLANVSEELPWGIVSKEAGQSAFEYLKTAVALAVHQEIDAIVTAPIHKEAWKLAGVPYPGHTEALADLSGVQSSAMMLVNRGLRVVHVTTHVSLREAAELATRERILSRIVMTDKFLKQFGVAKPRIAVAGLNPHAGEGGLFGTEELREIQPAILDARLAGIDVTGPYPPDSIYARAAAGEFDVVIAQYHDQGHIAIKMLGFDTGINVTLGLPILRTSVDHGTAFDIAGKGVAREHSMIAAIEVALQFLKA